ncbi:hypothetical protein E2C01_092290 [Portunus trituberculatus]|uniref:Uncharacterized protein n=1 Tax=Portunus trituberculatus TaxID=210409 RepID=A0A5B7JRC4_PORTR|nr:hypothetical protein [Portunus trituberculatus]
MKKTLPLIKLSHKADSFYRFNVKSVLKIPTSSALSPSSLAEDEECGSLYKELEPVEKKTPPMLNLVFPFLSLALGWLG